MLPRAQLVWLLAGRGLVALDFREILAVTTLVIQIPCLNEAETLPQTLAALPKQIEGVDEVKVLVIDDGSTDDTLQVALDNGVDAVARLRRNRGLATAFQVGLQASLSLGADIIVNTDADNQYDGACIPDLVQPILDGWADIVVGDRPLSSMKNFSYVKRCLQRLGSRIVGLFAGMRVVDAASGFRAFSAEAATRLDVHDGFSYTMETLVQARSKQLRVTSISVRVNPVERPSRLMTGTSQYVYRSAKAIVRAFALYRPLRFFLSAGSLFFLPGLILIARWTLLYLFATSYESRLPSLVLSVVLIVVGVQLWLFGFLADLMTSTRRLMTEGKVAENFEIIARP